MYVLTSELPDSRGSITMGVFTSAEAAKAFAQASQEHDATDPDLEVEDGEDLAIAWVQDTDYQSRPRYFSDMDSTFSGEIWVINEADVDPAFTPGRDA